MFRLMTQMLSMIDNKEIKKDKDFQLLRGLYKIPDSVRLALKQNKIR